MSDHDLTRRGFGQTLALLGAFGASPALAQVQRVSPLAALERRNGGRLGVFAWDTGSGRTLGHRADERFLLCSTFKALEAGAILHRVDAGLERLDRRVAFTPADLMPNSPRSQARVQRGWMTVEEHCAAMVEVSDNASANVMLPSIGGPAGLSRWLRSTGDSVTRLDRDEPLLNRASGALDTTSPRAYAATLGRLVLGNVLRPASRDRLDGWLLGATTGPDRLRAGLPAGWRLGHKTGTSDDQSNDAGVARPPGRAPILISAFYVSPAPNARRGAVLAEVARLVVAWAGR